MSVGVTFEVESSSRSSSRSSIPSSSSPEPPHSSVRPCGNGRIDGSEECDDGPKNSDTKPGACRISCRKPWCGDGVIDRGETCDDGMEGRCTGPAASGGAQWCNGKQPNAHCRTDCTLATCGDSITDTATEDCDLGVRNSDEVGVTMCMTDCSIPVCWQRIDAPEDISDIGLEALSDEKQSVWRWLASLLPSDFLADRLSPTVAVGEICSRKPGQPAGLYNCEPWTACRGHAVESDRRKFTCTPLAARAVFETGSVLAIPVCTDVEHDCTCITRGDCAGAYVVDDAEGGKVMADAAVDDPAAVVCCFFGTQSGSGLCVAKNNCKGRVAAMNSPETPPLICPFEPPPAPDLPGTSWQGATASRYVPALRLPSSPSSSSSSSSLSSSSSSSSSSSLSSSVSSTIIVLPVCGNGVSEEGEQCDHGQSNGKPGDTCTTACTIALPVCGNGIPESGEVCDDGERNGTAADGCLADCTLKQGIVPGCGNGVTEFGEQCDEGVQNGMFGAGCDASCRTSIAVQGLGADLTGHFSGGAQANLIGIGAFRALPVSTGPATIALMAAGAATGVAWMRHRRRRAAPARKL